MRSVQIHDYPGFLALAAALLLAAVQAQNIYAGQPTELGGYIWLDVSLQPLPFQDHATIRDMMRSAQIVSRKKIGRGVTGAEKLTLEVDSIRFHAVFRSVDVTKKAPPPVGVKRRPKLYRDSAIFESAAYELSEMLGISRVPPVVERRIGEQNGTVQIWMEETLPEIELIQRKLLQPPDVVRWRHQKQIMSAFDNLIANSDRNQGNLLIDRNWTLWLIDHTRAFRWTSKLLNRDKLTACERRLWKSLREIDEDTIRRRLEPFLTRQEISTLLRRRLKLIRHIQSLIDTHGEDAVLFDLRPHGAEKAEW